MRHTIIISTLLLCACTPDTKGVGPIPTTSGPSGDDDDDSTTSTSGADTTAGETGEDICGTRYTCALTVEPVYCRDGTSPCFTWDELLATYSLPAPNRICYGSTVAGAYHIPGSVCLESGDPTPSCVDQCNALTLEQLDLMDPWTGPDGVSWELTSRNCRTEANIQDDDYVQADCGSDQPSANGYEDGLCDEQHCNPGDDDDDDDVCDPAIVEWSSQGRCVWVYGTIVDWERGDATAQLPKSSRDDERRVMCIGPDPTLHTNAFDGEAAPTCGAEDMVPNGTTLPILDLQSSLLGQDFGLVEDWDHDGDPGTPDLPGFAFCEHFGTNDNIGQFFDNTVGVCGCDNGSCSGSDPDDVAVATETPCGMDQCSEIAEDCSGVDHDDDPSTPDIGYRDSGATYTRSGYTFYASLDLEWVDGFVRPDVVRLWVCNDGRFVVGGPGNIHDFQDLDVDSVPYDLGFRNGDHNVRVQATTGAPNYTRTGDLYLLLSQDEIVRAFDAIVPASGSFDLVFDVQTTAGTDKVIHVAVD